MVSVVGLGGNNFGRRLDLDGDPRRRRRRDRRGHHPLRHRRHLRRRGGERDAARRGAATGGATSVVLATKFGMDMGGANGPDWGARGSRRYIRLAVEASLRRLQTDWIDLYQYHAPDGITPIEETLAALDELVREGKVRYIGSSNLAAWQVADADWSRARRASRFICAQNDYSLLDRTWRRELGPACERARRRAPAVLPAGERPAHRQVPPGRAGAGGHAAWRRASTRCVTASVRPVEALETFAARARDHAARRRDRRAGRATGGRAR